MSAGTIPDLSQAEGERRWPWFVQFIRQELAPYPGRLSLVVRMVLAATLTMLCIMAGHLPQGALGGYYTLVIARENLQTTFKQSLQYIACFVAATLYIIVCAALFAASPLMHFLWVIGSLFMMFFIVSAGASYGLVGGFALIITADLPVWDGPLGVDTKIALTLYMLFTISIGTLSALAVEAVYRAFRPADPILNGIADRLEVAAAVLSAKGEDRAVEVRSKMKLEQYAMVGTSSLRRQLIRTARSARDRARGTTAIALSGRLVELCAAAENEFAHSGKPEAPERRRLHAVSGALRMWAAEVRTLRSIARIGTSRLPISEFEDAALTGMPTLPEIERSVTLFEQALTFFGHEVVQGEQAWREEQDDRRQAQWVRFFKPDIFTNREHFTFALRGCLAATLCYLFYSGLDWPGINTSLRTCVVTALTTIGSSRQKQILRIGGAVFGGFVIALPAQVYILPHLNTITGFTLFFVPVAALAAWLTTCSARLSYFGLQFALAFFLVNIEEPYEQISLAVARDRVVGILLGLVAMWLIFDRIASRDATSRMEELLRTNLTSLGMYAVLAGDPMQQADEASLTRARQLRGEISDTFSQMSAQADAMLFEFGPERPHKMRLRGRMKAMQPSMQSLFLMAISLHEVEETRQGERRTENNHQALHAFLKRCRDVLDGIASSRDREEIEQTLARLHEALPEPEKEDGEHGESAYTLCKRMTAILTQLQHHAMELAPSGK